MHHVKDIIFLRDPGAMYIFRLLLNPSPNMGIPSHFFLITELHRDATIVVISLNLQFCTSSICINRHTTNLYQHARDSCSMSGRATAVRSCIASPRVRGCAPTSGAGGGTVGIVQPRPFVFFDLSQEISSSSSFFFSSFPSSDLVLISHICYSSTGSRRQEGRGEGL